MKSKCTRTLLALFLVSASSLAFAKLGIPAQKYEVTYNYLGADFDPIGQKTYHCDSTVTKWGNTTGEWASASYVPCKNA